MYSAGSAKPAFAIRFNPAEHRGQDKYLPGFKLDHLSCERPFNVGQSFNEATEIIRGGKAAAVFVSEFWIKAVGTGLAFELCQVI